MQLISAMLFLNYWMVRRNLELGLQFLILQEMEDGIWFIPNWQIYPSNRSDTMEDFGGTELRSKREYLPYSIGLNKIENEFYQGTDIP